MRASKPFGRCGVVLTRAPRSDRALSIVLVWDSGCVLSDGRELLIRWGKLADLCRELCQEHAAVTVRTWQTKMDEQSMADELIEIHRAGASHDTGNAQGVDDALF